MNLGRRQFLKSLLLIPVALATKVQVEEEWGISPIESFYRDLGSPSETFAEIGEEVFDGYVEGIQAPMGVAENGMVVTLNSQGEWASWNSENCDPIADLQAVHDWIYEDRGLERQPLLMSKRFEYLFSERDKLSMRFI